jgi:hypothetical protein
MSESNFLGVHENIRIFMKRVGVEIKKNSSPPSNLTYTYSSPLSDSYPQMLQRIKLLFYKSKGKDATFASEAITNI